MTFSHPNKSALKDAETRIFRHYKLKSSETQLFVIKRKS
jgi:hypothetical protein